MAILTAHWNTFFRLPLATAHLTPNFYQWARVALRTCVLGSSTIKKITQRHWQRVAIRNEQLLKSQNVSITGNRRTKYEFNILLD